MRWAVPPPPLRCCSGTFQGIRRRWRYRRGDGALRVLRRNGVGRRWGRGETVYRLFADRLVRPHLDIPAQQLQRGFAVLRLSPLSSPPSPQTMRPAARGRIAVLIRVRRLTSARRSPKWARLPGRGNADAGLLVSAMKTFSAKPSDIEKKWLLVDAEGLVLGRLASILALRLRGKHKPSYTPHMDCGDNIIVVNAEKVELTGNKREGRYLLLAHRLSRRHQGAQQRRHPRRQASRAGRRKGGRAHAAARPAGRRIMKNLRVFAGPEHPHAAQQPTPLDVGAMNRKNVRA